MSGTNCALDYERQSNHVDGTKTVLGIYDRNSGRLTEGTAIRRFAGGDDAVTLFVSHEKYSRKLFTAFGTVNKRKACVWHCQQEKSACTIFTNNN